MLILFEISLKLSICITFGNLFAIGSSNIWLKSQSKTLPSQDIEIWFLHITFEAAIELKFEKYLISLECDDSWVKNKIKEALNVLNSNDMPNGSKACDTCQYLKKRWLVNQHL